VDGLDCGVLSIDAISCEVLVLIESPEVIIFRAGSGAGREGPTGPC